MKLSEEARKLQREYQKGWRQKNKEHIKAYNIEYWNTKAAESKARIREFVETNKPEKGE